MKFFAATLLVLAQGQYAQYAPAGSLVTSTPLVSGVVGSPTVVRPYVSSANPGVVVPYVSSATTAVVRPYVSSSTSGGAVIFSSLPASTYFTAPATSFGGVFPPAVPVSPPAGSYFPASSTPVFGQTFTAGTATPWVTQSFNAALFAPTPSSADSSFPGPISWPGMMFPNQPFPGSLVSAPVAPYVPATQTIGVSSLYPTTASVRPATSAVPSSGAAPISQAQWDAMQASGFASFGNVGASLPTPATQFPSAPASIGASTVGTASTGLFPTIPASFPSTPFQGTVGIQTGAALSPSGMAPSLPASGLPSTAPGGAPLPGTLVGKPGNGTGDDYYYDY